MPTKTVGGATTSSPLGGITTAQLHDTTHDPVGLWQLDGDLTDSSGNGNDLSVRAGDERYGPAAETDRQAFFFDGSTDLESAAVAALQIIDDVTLELLAFSTEKTSFVEGDRWLASCMGDVGSEAEGDNMLYSLIQANDNTSTRSNYLRLFLEENAGANLIYTLEEETHIPIFTWTHLAYVRDGATHKLFMNGVEQGSTAALGLPTKGGSPAQRIRVGGRGDANDRFVGMISSVKVVASALTDAQVLAEARRTLPPGLRP